MVVPKVGGGLGFFLTLGCRRCLVFILRPRRRDSVRRRGVPRDRLLGGYSRCRGVRFDADKNQMSRDSDFRDPDSDFLGKGFSSRWSRIPTSAISSTIQSLGHMDEFHAASWIHGVWCITLARRSSLLDHDHAFRKKETP